MSILNDGRFPTALPADGVPVHSGWLHVVAVTITGGPFFPRLAASQHQLLGRHYIETQTPISRFIPFSAAGVSGELRDDSAGGREFTITESHQ